VVEWLKAPHSKCGILARVSWVRIPPSPPILFPGPTTLQQRRAADESKVGSTSALQRWFSRQWRETWRGPGPSPVGEKRRHRTGTRLSSTGHGLSLLSWRFAASPADGNSLTEDLFAGPSHTVPTRGNRRSGRFRPGAVGRAGLCAARTDGQRFSFRGAHRQCPTHAGRSGPCGRSGLERSRCHQDRCGRPMAFARRPGR
jgi:hypothetical protein